MNTILRPDGRPISGRVRFSPSSSLRRRSHPACFSGRGTALLLAVLLAGAFAGNARAEDAASPSPPAVTDSSSRPAAAPAPPAPGDASSNPVPPPAEALSPATYRLGTGDIVTVRVARHADMDTETIVLEDGSISVPRVGRLTVTGITVLEAQEAIRKAMIRVLKNPEVTLTVKTPRVEQVMVYGPLAKAGPVLFKSGYRVTDALAQAGGLAVRQDWVTMTLTRRTGGTEAVPLAEILANPSSGKNVAVSPGDILMVQEIPPQPYFITGAIVKPGMYDIREVAPSAGSIGALEALTLAGGPTDNAALSQAVILRAASGAAAGAPRREERVNLSRFRQAAASLPPVPVPGSAVPAAGTGTVVPAPAADTTPADPVPAAAPAPGPDTEVRLYPGDTLQIPEMNAKIVVMGHVAKPGVFNLTEDHEMTLAEAIGLAGGPLPDRRARIDKVGIIRPADPSQGPGVGSKIIEADLKKLIDKRDLRQNIALRAGDVVYVPESNKPDWAGKILPSVASFGSLLYMIGITR